MCADHSTTGSTTLRIVLRVALLIEEVGTGRWLERTDHEDTDGVFAKIFVTTARVPFGVRATPVGSEQTGTWVSPVHPAASSAPDVAQAAIILERRPGGRMAVAGSDAYRLDR